jgi:hypothetical protein
MKLNLSVLNSISIHVLTTSEGDFSEQPLPERDQIVNKRKPPCLRSSIEAGLAPDSFFSKRKSGNCPRVVPALE